MTFIFSTSKPVGAELRLREQAEGAPPQQRLVALADVGPDRRVRLRHPVPPLEPVVEFPAADATDDAARVAHLHAQEQTAAARLEVGPARAEGAGAEYRRDPRDEPGPLDGGWRHVLVRERQAEERERVPESHGERTLRRPHRRRRVRRARRARLLAHPSSGEEGRDSIAFSRRSGETPLSRRRSSPWDMRAVRTASAVRTARRREDGATRKTRRPRARRHGVTLRPRRRT